MKLKIVWVSQRTISVAFGLLGVGFRGSDLNPPHSQLGVT